jgi:hypothetical protein
VALPLTVVCEFRQSRVKLTGVFYMDGYCQWHAASVGSRWSHTFQSYTVALPLTSVCEFCRYVNNELVFSYGCSCVVEDFAVCDRYCCITKMHQ